MKRVPVAVVGGGHLGRIHARLLGGMPEAELVAVVDPDEGARRHAAEQFGVAAISDIDRLPEVVEAVVLAAPTSLHVALGERLMRRGLHVLVEKPLAPSAAEAQVFLQAARQHPVVVQVGHVEQFNPLIEQLRAQLAGCRYIHARRCGPYTGRSTDVSAVLDLMIHDIDLIASLAGQPPRSVAACGIVGPGPHWDAAQARLTFDSGLTADLLASRLDLQADRVWQVVADDWYGRLDLATRQGHLVAASTPSPPPSGLHVQPVAAASDANPLREELRNFLRSVRGLETPRVTPLQACQALRIADQIQRQLDLQHPSPLAWRRAG